MRQIFFFLLLFCSSLAVNAQWTTNTVVNTEVSSANTADTKLLATSDGKTWMPYFKFVGAPNYYEVRAQLLDKDGVKLLGPEGVLVNNAPHSSFFTVFSAMVDANNNLITAFTVSTTPNTVYVNKTNTSGAQVWSSGGVAIPNAINPKVNTLINGDVIVSWLPTAGTVTRAAMLRLDASTGNSVWGATPINVEPFTTTHRTTPGHILPLSNNEFIHVFHNRTGTSGTTSTLWAQRYNAAGVPQWSTPVQLTDKATAFNRDYYPVMHNDTLFLGYYGATGLRFDSYLQRLNPNGTLPWGINGSDFNLDNTFYETETYIVADPVNNVVWSTCRQTNTSQGSIGTYVQKYNKSTGARLFTDNARTIYSIASPVYVQPLGIGLFSDNLPVLFLGKNNSATSQFLYAAKLNSTGNFVWPNDTVALATAPLSKSRMAFTRVVNDQAVAGWVETKGTIPQPYAQPIRINGATGLVPPVAAFTISTGNVCRGVPVQFTSNSTGFVTTYNWSFPGGNPATSTSANPTVVYPANGVYNATLTVTNAAGSNSITRNNIINVQGIIASAGPDKVIVNGYDVLLEGSTSAGTPASISWTPAGTLLNAGTLNPNAKPSQNTTYTITVRDNNGCVSTDDVLVTVLPYCVKPLNAFTPNGDGTNDLWNVTTGGGCVSNVTVVVYNRYGGVVYKNDNYLNNWNGTYNGKPVADGTYYYVVTYQLVSGPKLVMKGDVTILR